MDLITKPYSVTEMVGQFLVNRPTNTTSRYWLAIKRWVGFLQPEARDLTEANWQPLLTADAHTVKLFVTHLRGKGIDYATLSVYRAALTGFYYELIGTGFKIPNGNPWLMVKFPRGSTRPKKPTVGLNEEQSALLLSLPDQNHEKGRRDYAILCLLLGAGLRASEALGVTYGDIKRNRFGDYCIKVRTTKGKRFREVDVSEWVGTGILSSRGLLDSRVCAFSRKGLHKWFKRYLRQAFLDTRLYSLHSCRKAAITRLLDSGNPHREVQSFSGHSSVQMVERYDDGRRGRSGAGIRLLYGGLTEP